MTAFSNCSHEPTSRWSGHVALQALVFAVSLLCVTSFARAQEAPAHGGYCGPENLLAGLAPSAEEQLEGPAVAITDGQIATAGFPWDGAPAVPIGAQGHVTYDLGAPRSITALYLQADANDAYAVSASIEGTPGSFSRLSVLEEVPGHGLRARTARVTATTARYLQLSPLRGDRAFSVSEFAAYCRAPDPFPPAFRIAEVGSMIGRPDPDPPSTASETRQNVFWAAAALFGLLGLGMLIRRLAREPAGVAAPEERDELHGLLRLLFLGGGCAALIYEVVWLHLLRLVIGASALSVGIVLASFMGGMFLGSLLFSRFVSEKALPLKVYAWLELGIGVFGLLMPLALPLVRSVYVGLFGYGALGIALRALIAGVMLLPPTALMGATLPAIARRYAPGRQGMSRLSSLYAANTVGAVLGSSLSAFYLLANWDIWVATVVAASINFVIGLVALRASKKESASALPTLAAPHAARLVVTRKAAAVYFAIGCSGLTALGAQVIWTRLLTLLFGATVYAFAIILAVFLAGLGIGSALAASLLRKGFSATRGLAWTQVALIPVLVLSSFILARVTPYSSPQHHLPISALHALHVLRAIDIILPATVLWGMSFPFALAAASVEQSDPGRSSGYVYAANTLGAIVGALLVSFAIIPNFGTHVASQLLVLGSGVSAAALFAVLGQAQMKARRAQQASISSKAFNPALVLALAAAGAALTPGISHVFLAHGRYLSWADPRDQYPYVREGAASTVAVHIAPDGYYNFHVSGRVEATNNPNDLRLERLLGHLSALAHPKPESVLVVGLGAGVTAGSFVLHPEVKRIVICEIEPRVAGAAHQFAPENYGVMSDPRVEVVFDDARHFLATTRERFDIITSDPIHPWVRGNSILFSREYYAIVASRLKPGGIATQWVPLYETSERAIQMQMRTFVDAFPNGTVWNSAITGRGYDVVLLGRSDPLRLDLPTLEARMRNPRIRQSLLDVKIGDVVDLLATYGTRGPDLRRWLANTPVNRDFSLKLEYISGLALNRREADPIYQHLIADRRYPEDLFVGPEQQLAAIRQRIARNTPR